LLNRKAFGVLMEPELLIVTLDEAFRCS